MAIRVLCPNGHVLRVKDSLAGRTGLCPICKAPATVPEPERSAVDDSTILNILGPYSPSPSKCHSSSANTVEEEPKAFPAKKELRLCPHCEKPIDAEVHICPYCKHYIGGAGDL